MNMHTGYNVYIYSMINKLLTAEQFQLELSLWAFAKKIPIKRAPGTRHPA